MVGCWFFRQTRVWLWSFQYAGTPPFSPYPYTHLVFFPLAPRTAFFTGQWAQAKPRNAQRHAPVGPFCVHSARDVARYWIELFYLFFCHLNPRDFFLVKFLFFHLWSTSTSNHYRWFSQSIFTTNMVTAQFFSISCISLFFFARVCVDNMGAVKLRVALGRHAKSRCAIIGQRFRDRYALVPVDERDEDEQIDGEFNWGKPVVRRHLTIVSKLGWQLAVIPSTNFIFLPLVACSCSSSVELLNMNTKLLLNRTIVAIQIPTHVTP